MLVFSVISLYFVRYLIICHTEDPGEYQQQQARPSFSVAFAAQRQEVLECLVAHRHESCVRHLDIRDLCYFSNSHNTFY